MDIHGFGMYKNVGGKGLQIASSNLLKGMGRVSTCSKINIKPKMDYFIHNKPPKFSRNFVFVSYYSNPFPKIKYHPVEPLIQYWICYGSVSQTLGVFQVNCEWDYSDSNDMIQHLQIKIAHSYLLIQPPVFDCENSCNTFRGKLQYTVNSKFFRRKHIPTTVSKCLMLTSQFSIVKSTFLMVEFKFKSC